MSAALCTRLWLGLILLGGTCGPLLAQSTDTISATDVRDISITGPSADSPFYTEREEAKTAMAKAAREGLGMYAPKPPRPPVQQQMKKFFTGMFGSVRFKKDGGLLPMILSVEPREFSLAQTQEIEVSLKITNPMKREIEFVYPTQQRLEVLTKDASGNVIGRWSEDRSFDPLEGFVAVNPVEFINYAERIPTTAMKAGETYTIEASLAGQDGYTATTTVTPQP